MSVANFFNKTYLHERLQIVTSNCFKLLFIPVLFHSVYKRKIVFSLLDYWNMFHWKVVTLLPKLLFSSHCCSILYLLYLRYKSHLLKPKRSFLSRFLLSLPLFSLTFYLLKVSKYYRSTTAICCYCRRIYLSTTYAFLSTPIQMKRPYFHVVYLDYFTIL